jgi:hypothetical protein
MEKKESRKRTMLTLIVILVLVGIAFFVYRQGIFSTETKKVEVKVEVPVSPKLPPQTPLTLPTPDSAPSEPAPPHPSGP